MGIIVNLETGFIKDPEFSEISKATTKCFGEIFAYGYTPANAIYNLLEKLDDRRLNIEATCNALRSDNIVLYNNQEKITETADILQDFNKLKCMKKIILLS